MIDSHVHLDFDELSKSLDSLIEACNKVSVDGFIVPSVSESNFLNVISLSERYAQVYAAIGIHPWFVADNHLGGLSFRVSELISKYEIIAVGEIGLDKLKPNYALQLDFFEAQLQIAQEHEVPVIIHCVKAHQDVLRLLKKYSVSGVVHGWGGSIEQAELFVEQGMKLGIGGAITYPKRKKLRSAIRGLPLEVMVLETDAPAMPLYGLGELNSPINIPVVAAEVAAIKSIAVGNVVRIMTKNTMELFSL